MMLHANERFSEAVGRRVAEIETKTDAEVVIVASERSGSYRDVSMALGAGAALIMFVVLLSLPWSVHPVFAIVDVVAPFLLVAWLAEGHPLPVRLAGRRRRERQVHEAAAATFHLDAVHATPLRLGLLVYVSAAEGLVELVPDLGLERVVPRPTWTTLAAGCDATDLDAFLRGLDAVGAVLATHVPPTATRTIGLADAPRVRGSSLPAERRALLAREGPDSQVHLEAMARATSHALDAGDDASDWFDDEGRAEVARWRAGARLPPGGEELRWLEVVRDAAWDRFEIAVGSRALSFRRRIVDPSAGFTCWRIRNLG